jgi:hypothetical protein
MFPQKLQFWGWTFFISSDSYEIEYGENHRYESVISSPNKLFNAIKEGGYDYILITYGDKTLWRDYATIFDKQGDHHEVHLYHVGDKSLTLVE